MSSSLRSSLRSLNTRPSILAVLAPAVAFALFHVGNVLMGSGEDAAEPVRFAVFAASLAALATGCFVAGYARHRPVRPAPWVIATMGFGAITFSFSYQAVQMLTGQGGDTVGAADFALLAGYAALAGSLLLLVQGRRSPTDRINMIDSTIINTGLGLILWSFFLHPLIVNDAIPLPNRMVELAFPLFDLILLGTATRLLLEGRRGPVMTLFLLASLGFFLADVGQLPSGLFASGLTDVTLDGLRLLAFGAWAAVGLSPMAAAFDGRRVSLARPLSTAAQAGRSREATEDTTSQIPVSMPATVETTPEKGVNLSAARLVALALAMLIAPTLLLIHFALGQDLDVLVTAPASAMIGLFVFFRLAGVIGILHGTIAAREVLRRDLDRERTVDSLTGLATRHLFIDRAEAALATSEPVTLMMANVRDLKSINDLSGHANGDLALRLVAHRIAAVIGGDGLVGRMGGDEFSILLTGAAAETSSDSVARILGAMKEPFALEERTLGIHLRIGVASAASQMASSEASPVAPHHVRSRSRDFFDLLRNANIAMFVAKADGKSRAEFFAPSMLDQILDHSRGLAELEAAIAAGEIVSYFQPIVNLADGTILGAEALARWQHPVRGLVPPAKFIPLAESSGLVVPMGAALLAQACAQAARWPRDAAGHVPGLHVNVTVAQLRDGTFPARVAAVLADSGLPSDRLTLEVIETDLVEPAVIEALRHLRTLGVHLAIDDFGTGYSSLSYLAKLPVDTLKIDRSFVSPLDAPNTIDARTGRSAARDILAGIVGLANSLSLTMVAEGVETEAQRAVLASLGVREAQGYIFARPMPADDLFARLLEGPASQTSQAQVQAGR